MEGSLRYMRNFTLDSLASLLAASVGTQVLPEVEKLVAETCQDAIEEVQT